MGMLIWQEFPNAWNIIGIAIIICAGLMVWHQEVRGKSGSR